MYAVVRTYSGTRARSFSTYWNNARPKSKRSFVLCQDW
jgi:hypothetical protein